MNVNYRSPDKFNYVVEYIHNVKLLHSLCCRRYRRDNRKSGLNKSFSDCAIAQFVDILHHQAQKLGVKILKINPRKTSQTCPICLNKVPKSLSERWHDCPTCKASMDRDYASSLLIKKVALGIVSL